MNTKIIGFAFANPAILMAVIKYAKYIPFIVDEANQTNYDEAKKFAKKYRADTRTKVVMFHHVGTLARFIADDVMDLTKSIVVIFDSIDVLTRTDGVVVVDAKLRGATMWEPEPVNLDDVLQAASIGVGTFGVVPEEPAPAPASKPVPEVKAVPEPVAADDAPATEEPAPKALPPDSLSALFDGSLALIPDETKRQKAASWVAARLEGLLDKEAWQQALEKIQKYGVDPELIRGGFRVLKESGKLTKLRQGYQILAETGVISDAAKSAGVPKRDLRWLHQRWSG